ncbi:MAG: hypothetical protein ACJAWV_001696 [Flammeovirgaceae bacterium]|jgi:hypothetical protein
MKPQGNHPLRFPTIYNISISKKEMGIITGQGLIKGIDENGFVIFDSENLSGSHVYWANLKEIRQSADEDSIVLIYKNMSDEILGNHHFGWNELMESIPDDFGNFMNMMKDSESVEEEPKDDIEVENAEYILSKINKMREDFMEDGNDEVSSEKNAEEESEIVEPEKVVAVSDSNRKKVTESKAVTTPKKSSNEELLRKILSEASGSSYEGNTRFQNTDSELEESLNFGTNTKILQASSLGFDAESQGKTHKIDFGKFSDAFFDTKSNSLVFEHRFGKTITVSNQVVDFQNLLSKIPFRFRSFDRKLIS